MSQKQLFKVPNLRAPKAAPKRRLRHRETLPGGIFLFDIYSLTHRGREVAPQLEPDVQTGALRCSCADFSFRHARRSPTIFDPAHICKHLRRVLDWLVRNGEVDAEEVALRAMMEELRPCCDCGAEGAQYRLCDEQGEVIEGFRCCGCYEAMQGDLAAVETRLDDVRRELLEGEWELEKMKQARLELTSVPYYGSWSESDELVFDTLFHDLHALSIEREVLEREVAQ